MYWADYVIITKSITNSVTSYKIKSHKVLTLEDLQFKVVRLPLLKMAINDCGNKKIV